MPDLGYNLNNGFTKENQVTDPTVLRGLEAWWDFDDASTITTTTGILIDTVTDKSGNGHTLTQTVEARRPDFQADNIVTGRNNAEFNGTDEWLIGNSLATSGIVERPYTEFAVFKTQTIASQDIVTAFNDSSYTNGDSMSISSTYVESTFWDSAGTSEIATPQLIENRITIPLIVTLKVGIDNDRVGLVVNSTSNKVELSNYPSTWAPSARNYFSVGQEWDSGPTASNFFDGYLGEIIFYNRLLSDYEAVLVENYLAKKWGIDLS